MNYSEIKKQKEQALNDAQAKLLARKKIIQDELAKRSKLEKECQAKLGISLDEVPGKIKTINADLEKLVTEFIEEVDQVEQKLSAIID